MLMKLLLHTTLFVDGNAVSYKIYYDVMKGKYFFKPNFVTLRFPSLYVSVSDGSCQIEGCDDKHICLQVMEDVKNVVGLENRPIM